MSRRIDQMMINYVDAKLAANGLARHAVDVKDARLLFGLAVESCVGIHEVGGNNQGPLVESIQKSIGRPVGQSWCMDFVQCMLAYAELKTGKTSPVFASEHCQTVWRTTDLEARVKVSPLKYAIIIWKHEGTSAGHTGVVIEPVKDSHLVTIEGNTNSAGSRDGDGVFVKRRHWIRDGDLVKLGFLKPF